VKVRVLLSALKRMIEGDPASVARLKALPGAVVETLDLSKTTGGILHAKYWVVDRKEVYVGSQNLDWRSLSQIHELGLRVRDERIAKELDGIFEHDLALARGKVPPGSGGMPEPQAEDRGRRSRRSRRLQSRGRRPRIPRSSSSRARRR